MTLKYCLPIQFSWRSISVIFLPNEENTCNVLHFVVMGLIMKLKTYLDQNHIARKDFAFELGIHFSHLYHILKGTRYPSAKLAFKIEEKTNGAITALELLKRKNKEHGDSINANTLIPV